MNNKVDEFFVSYASKLSSNNKTKLKDINSCYFCINHIKKEDIVEFTDRGSTALCPFCGIDSIIPDKVDIETLAACCVRYFTATK
jgi:hypothetical protein